jgi:hypothetical protein
MSMSSFALATSLAYFFTSAAVGNRPSFWQVRLHTANPADGANNEVGDPGYSRQEATFTLNGGQTAVSNAAEMNFGTAVSGFTVTHISIWDSANGVSLATQRLSADKVVAAGAQVIMAAGELTIGGAA